MPLASTIPTRYSGKDLVRGIVSLRLAQSSFISRNADKWFDLFRGSPTLSYATNLIIKKTIFSHFCGGEDIYEVDRVAKKLLLDGIHPILDYAAEATSGPKGSNAAFDEVVGRNKSVLGHIIKNYPIPMMATKLTGFGDLNTMNEGAYIVHLLLEFVRSISERRSFGDTFYMPHPYQELYQYKLSEGEVKQFFMEKGRSLDLGKYNLFIEETNNWIRDNIDTTRDRNSCTDITSLGGLFVLVEGLILSITKTLSTGSQLFLESFITDLSNMISDDCPIKKPNVRDVISDLSDVIIRWEESLAGLKKAPAALEGDMVSPLLLIDAEWFKSQALFDVLTRHEMLISNKNGAVIGNTYQMYLKESPSKLKADMHIFNELRVPFALKMVRGAYINSERLQARQEAREDPINKNIQATHDAYNSCIPGVIEQCVHFNGRCVFGTHNHDSNNIILREIDQYSADDVGHGDIMLCQLMGMADKLTDTASQNKKITACKYVPYGPVPLVMPYLVRRAQENAAAIANVVYDKAYLQQNLATLMRRRKRLQKM